MCADAWDEGGEWKVCYIKSRMFILLMQAPECVMLQHLLFLILEVNDFLLLCFKTY